MPSLSKVKQDCDKLIQQHWPEIQRRETNYFDTYAVQFQALWSHIAPPRHSQALDGSIIPDNLIAPTDLPHNLLDFYSELATSLLPFRLRIDVYNAPEGRGYVLTVEFEYLNADLSVDLHRKAVQVGPLTSRAYEWKIIPPEPPIVL